MASFEIKFKTDNSAFNECEGSYELETARILKRIACQVESGKLHGVVTDINGNSIGTWEFRS